MGALFDEVADFWTLRSAARKAALGCGTRSPAAARFLAELEGEVLALQRELRGGSYRPGALRTFPIREPKPRVISAAPFRDRVVHHAVCKIMEPRLEELADPDSFACRRGKGTLRALWRVQQHARRWPWFAKLDVLHCFETADLGVLSAQLRAVFPDEDFLALVDRILLVGAPGEGRGLPIGNLTSQHLANLLLGRIDREARRLSVGGWVRYMDDMFLFGPDKASVRAQADTIAAFIRDELHQYEKVSARRLGPTHGGVPALGFRVWPQRIRFDGARRRRFHRQLRRLERGVHRGEMAEEDAARRAAALLGWSRHGDTLGLRQALVAGPH